MKKLSVLILVLGLADVASAALVGQWTFEGSVATNSGTAGAAADGTLVNEASYLFDGTTLEPCWICPVPAVLATTT